MNKTGLKKILIILIALVSFGVVLFFSGFLKSVAHTKRIYKKATYLISHNQNPADALSTAEHTLNNFLFRGLFRVNGKLEIESDLIREWKLDETTKTYFLDIAKGDVFSDGTAVTIEDIYKSLNYLFFKSKNSSSFNNIKSLKFNQSGLLVIVVYDTSVPLLPLLAAPQVKIWKKNKQNSQFIGSGPYRIFEFKESPRKSISLLQNENYSGGLKYKLKSLELVQMTETEARLEIQGGAIDDTIDIPFSDFLPENSTYYKIESPAAITWLVSFNVKSGFLNSFGNRQCLISKFNKSQFVKRFLQTHDQAVGYLPKSVPGSIIIEQKSSSIKCKFKSDESFELVIPREVDNAQKMCDFFRESWQSNFRQFKCHVIPFNDLLNQISKGKHQAALLAMSLDFPSVEYFFNAFESNSQFNLSAFASKELDFLLNKSRKTKDKELKSEFYQKINQLIYDNALTLNISNPRAVSYVNRCVKGLGLSISGPSYTDYSSVFLEDGCQNINR